MKKTLLILCLATLVSVNFAFGQKYAEKGSTCPEFSFTTLAGKTVNLSDLKGKVIYINFMATWCPPCKKELPYVEKDIWNTIKDERFVMVVIGREHTQEELEKFKKQFDYTFPMAADENRAIFSLFAESQIPRNVIIDKKGQVIYNHSGFEESEFHKMIELIKKELNK